MGSDSALAQHWEKIVLVAAILVFGLALFFAKGYFKIKEPGAEIGQLGERFREAKGKPNTTAPTEELIGLKRLETALDPAAGAQPAPVWSFYNYMGIDLRMKEQVVELRYCPPRMVVKSSVSETTGEVTITFEPQKGEALPPRGQFTFEIYRFLLAAGKETATLLTTSDSFVVDVTDAVDKSPPGSQSPPLVFGTSYVYYAIIKLNDGVLLADGCKQRAETSSVDVTTPDRFKVVGFRKDGSKSFLKISSLDVNVPTTEVRVTTHVLKNGAPVETDSTVSAEFGEYYPVRPQQGSQFSKNFEFHDLQRSFFDLFYTRRSTEKTNVAPGGPPGEGSPGEGTPGEEGMKEDGAPKEAGDKPKPPPAETSGDPPTKPKKEPENPFEPK